MVRLVVMAAGQASRMGRDKLQLPWRGTTVLGYVLQTALEAAAFVTRQKQEERSLLESEENSLRSEGISLRSEENSLRSEGISLRSEEIPLPPFFRAEIVVVARQPLTAYLNPAQKQLFHGQGGVWLQVPEAQPLSETVRCGLRELGEDIRYIGFLPGDQAGVTVRGLAECLRQAGRASTLAKDSADFLAPEAGGKIVSPVFFHRRYVQELSELRGEQGGKTILNRYREKRRIFSVENGFAMDLDTPEQYEIAIMEEQNKQRNDA